VRRGELDKRVENAKTKFDNLVENAKVYPARIYSCR
jgi:hypothetical protein